MKVRARGTAMVPAYHQHPARRFVGRKPEQQPDGSIGWVPTGDVEVPPLGEYLMAIRDGDLWPADAETARAADVKFDPKFGARAAEEKRT